MGGEADARDRMRQSLEGLAAGDAFGDRFFFGGAERQERWLGLPYAERPLPPGSWEYTDDTQMALSIAEVLSRLGEVDQGALAASFGARFERMRGYGPAMYDLLPALRAGADWRAASAALFGGAGSYGNGAAMRVAPLGAFFAEDVGRAAEQAALSAEVTHRHPEAVAGAVAVAVAAAVAWQTRAGPPPAADFIGMVLAHTPAGEVRRRLAAVREIPPEEDVWRAVAAVGNGSGITAQDTVPFAVWCAARALGDYERAVWDTAAGLGDIDTNCAIVGGIVAAGVGAAGIPPRWLELREPLPAWALGGPP